MRNRIQPSDLGLVVAIFACLFLSTQANWLNESEVISSNYAEPLTNVQQTARFVRREVSPRRRDKKRGETRVQATPHLNDTIDTRISETISMLLEGESQIVLTDSEEVVIILGISGSGKSTLLQFLTGDNNKLIATKIRNVMIIKDTNNKIGSTTKSHTKIPELSVDQFGNHFYDCPGFKDTNDAIYDIASGYFIKKVFDNAKKVKILLTISFTKVLHGNDRAGFVSLAEQVFELLPNIDKFNESIAMIVTKVDRMIDTYDQDDMPIFLSDEDKIYDIAGFLEGVKSDYEDLMHLKGREKVEKMTSLINILLTTEGETFTRIGLFNRPYKEGPLSADAKLQQSKLALQSIINNNMQFTRKENADTQYSISDSSKLYLSNFNDAVVSSINNKKLELIKHISNSYLHSYDDISKISTFRNDLLSIISNFSNNNSNTSNENYIQMYVKLRSILKTMKNFDADQDILQILNLIRFLNIMKTFSPDDSNDKLSAQINRFSGMESFVASLQNWYTFTHEFEAYLSQYDVQVSKSSYRDKFNFDIQAAERTTNISQFFNSIPQRFLHAKKAFQLIVDTEPKFADFLCQQLNEILTHTLADSNLTEEINGDEVFVSGDFVKLSDAMTLLVGKHFKFINIFALNKVFIDASVVATQGKHLAIISPVWEVVSKNEITLQGEDGETHKTQAQSRTSTGEAGSHGKHGTAGQSSGNFIGIGDNIINGNLLRVSTQGGHGGSGQNGGDGAPGKIGQESPYWHTVLSHQCRHGVQKSSRKFSTMAHQFGCDATPYDASKLILIIVNELTYYRNCQLFGSQGSDGGHGGNGGNAASGGAPGKIVLKFNKNGSSVKKTQQVGKTGQKGYSGLPGKGGSQMYHTFQSMEENRYWIVKLIKNYRYCFFIKNFSLTRKQYNAGRIGKPGNITIKQNIDTKIDNLPDIINKYKTLAYPNIINGRNKNLLLEFSIFKDKELNSYFTLLDYAKELLALEKIDSKHKTNSNFNLLYSSLSAKANSLKSINPDEIKLKRVVNAIIMSQSYVANIQRLKQVTDINAYNKFIKEKIALYANSDIKRLKSETTVNFIDHFEKQSKEAANLIKNSLNDGFESYQSSFESNFELAVKECLELQNKASNNVKTLEQKEKAIQEKLKTIQMFSPLKSILKVVQFFGFVLPYAVDTLKIVEIIAEPSKSFLDKVSELREALEETIEEISLQKNTTVLQITQDYNIEDKFLEEDLFRVRTLISANTLKLEELQSYQQNLYDILKPCLSNIKNELIMFEKNMASNSRVVLNVNSWEVRKNLNLIQDIITKFTRGYEIEIKFIKMIHNLKNTIELIIKLYEQIQDYSEEQTLFQYISLLSSMQHNKITFSREKYNNIANQLENAIHSNMVTSLYLQLVATVKQHVFPYAESYIYFEHLNFTSMNMTLRDKANLAVTQINQITDELTRKRATIVSGQDKDMFTGDFHSKFMISEPFYSWTDSQHQKQLERFLSGDEVILKSNIQTMHIKNAVKFTYIALNVKAKTSERQKMLDLILSRYIVRMKHPGNSYYKCDSKYFVVNSESQVFEYSYEKQNNTTPVYQNEVYRKTAAGDLLLSPYTEWRFQLIDKKSNGFDELSHFNGEVSLELIGSGQYIRDNVYICQSNLENFYTVFDDKDEKFEISIQHLKEGLELTDDNLYVTSGDYMELESM